MSITADDLEHLAHLSYLNAASVADQLGKCNAIIKQIERLQKINTSDVSPLNHPTSVTQFLRIDEANPLSNLHALAENAPLFDNDMYIVPLVIKE